jgi:hypothetical protein
LRNTVLTGLALRRPPLIVHSFDCEFEMVRWCEALWPGKKVPKIRKAMERERTAWAAGVQGTT